MTKTTTKSIASLNEAELDAIADLALRYLEPYGPQTTNPAFEVTSTDIEILTEKVCERMSRRYGLQGLSFLVVQCLAGGRSKGKSVSRKSVRKGAATSSKPARKATATRLRATPSSSKKR